jgi:hypothetical protein
MNTSARKLYLATLVLAFPFRAAAEDFPDAVQAYLRQCVEPGLVNAGIVVGIVDEHGRYLISAPTSSRPSPTEEPLAARPREAQEPVPKPATNSR